MPQTPMLLLAATAAAAVVHASSGGGGVEHNGNATVPVVVTVHDGVLQSSGEYVGVYTSVLQSRLVGNSSVFPAVVPADWADVSLVNSSTLRYLQLVGDYYADVPLQLPSLFVLRLNGTLSDAANLSSGGGAPPSRSSPWPRFTGLVTLNRTQFSAVDGGTFNATVHNATAVMAVAVLDSFHTSVRNVRAVAQYDAAVGVNGGSYNEVNSCELGGEPGRMSPVRALWTLATTRVYVLNNHVHHSASHALDFDAYTANSVAFNNTCEDNTDEGIFVEETAHDNVVAGNTCRRNANGIGVYSNAVGPVANNVFVGNAVAGNGGSGISAGGLGHAPSKHSEGNVFVGNAGVGNGRGLNPMHGAVQGDYWVSNTDDNPQGPWYMVPAANANVSMFDPAPATAGARGGRR